MLKYCCNECTSNTVKQKLHLIVFYCIFLPHNLAILYLCFKKVLLNISIYHVGLDDMRESFKTFRGFTIRGCENIWNF